MRFAVLCGLILSVIVVGLPTHHTAYACVYQPDPSSPRSASLGQMPLDFLVREATHIIVGDIVSKRDRGDTTSTIIIVDEYLKGSGSSVVEVAEIKRETETLPCQPPPIPLGTGSNRLFYTVARGHSIYASLDVDWSDARVTGSVMALSGEAPIPPTEHWLHEDSKRSVTLAGEVSGMLALLGFSLKKGFRLMGRLVR